MSEWQPLLDRVARATGFELDPIHIPEILAAARRAMGRERLPSMAEWLARVDAGAASLTEVIDESLIGETYFFREPAQFDQLARLLPDLPGPIHLWSAGCASGEEAYSLAMTAREAGVGDRARVRATDLSSRALARGRAARYDGWSLRGPAADRARVWLRLQPGPRPQYAIEPQVRDMVAFEQLNLAYDRYPADVAVIFCRNVLIYLRKEVRARVFAQLYASLRPGGWLFLGASDPIPGRPFEVFETDLGLFHRRPGEAATSLPPTLASREPGPRPRPRAVPRNKFSRPPGMVQPPPPGGAPQASETPRPGPVETVRGLADRGELAGARQAAEEGLKSNPLLYELHYLHAVVLTALGEGKLALAAVRRALYLEPQLLMGWFTLGTLLRAEGNRDGARRAFEAAARLCRKLDPDTPVPMADGVTGAYFCEIATREEARC